MKPNHSRTSSIIQSKQHKTLESKRRTRKQRRQSQGSAWFWQQTNTWYFTEPGTRKRVPLYDAAGQRIRGREQQAQADEALAKLQTPRLTRQNPQLTLAQQWTVQRVCDTYLQYCAKSVEAGTMSANHYSTCLYTFRNLCRSCSELTLRQLKKQHIRAWTENQPGWKSPSTIRSVLKMVLAAFNYVQREHDVSHPLRGYKKPSPIARLQSFSAADEQALYQAANPAHRDFLFAAIHTGLRPFCELAKLQASDVETTTRGMMWHVYSSKTKKRRKLPVRKEVAKLTTRLIARLASNSQLPIFRTIRKQAWTRCNGVNAFITLRKRLGWDRDPSKRKFSTYTCRHTFAHRMLSGFWNNSQGCSIEVLAELLGDTPKVAFEHYGKEWGQYYQEPLWTAIGLAPIQSPVVSKRANRRRI
jgi:integrase